MDLREEIAKRSLKKRKKYHLTKGKIKGDRILELGCSAAGLSKMLIQGKWLGLDLDKDVVRDYSRYLKMPGVVSKEKLPLKDDSFNTILMFDFLEHVDGDTELLRESARILKRGGTIIITTPRDENLFMTRIKNFIGLKKEAYGHKREGYSREKLVKMVEEAGFRVEEVNLYSGFFLEIMEAIQNLIYFKISKKKQRRAGNINPVEEEEIKKMEKLLSFYKLAYPLFLFADFLDRVLRTKKHAIFLRGTNM